MKHSSKWSHTHELITFHFCYWPSAPITASLPSNYGILKTCSHWNYVNKALMAFRRNNIALIIMIGWRAIRTKFNRPQSKQSRRELSTQITEIKSFLRNRSSPRFLSRCFDKNYWNCSNYVQSCFRCRRRTIYKLYTHKATQSAMHVVVRCVVYRRLCHWVQRICLCCRTFWIQYFVMLWLWWCMHRGIVYDPNGRLLC